MKKEDLKKITLETPIYHPFLGKGFPIRIEEENIIVKFSEGILVEFSSSGSVDNNHFLRHIYLKPVGVVEID